MDREKFENDYIFDWMLMKKEDDSDVKEESKETTTSPQNKVIQKEKTEPVLVKKVVQNKVK